MASSSDAFEKFWIWKKSKTPLKVTLIHSGSTVAVLDGRIYTADSESGTVGMFSSEVHSYQNFNVNDAVFSVEPFRVVATLNTADWLIFEELPD